MNRKRTRQVVILAAFLVGSLALTARTFADEHLRGVIVGHGSNGTLTVRADDSSETTVVLQESTKVWLVSGVRYRRADVPSLIAGLRVTVEGAQESQNQLVAESIAFTREDLKMARDVQAGVAPSDQAIQANRAMIAAHQQQLEQGAQRLTQQQAELEQHQRMFATTDEKIVATAGALNGRIANLDTYTVLESVTVYFRNGQAVIAPQYESQLQQLVAKAKGVEGYKVQVEGFASAVGSKARNQELSKRRADNVAAVLQQSGVAPTNMLVPAAMGITEQVATNRTASGQAQNRRTVVRLLQNRGITGN